MISGLKTKMSEVKVELIKMIKLIVLLGKISKEDIRESSLLVLRLRWGAGSLPGRPRLVLGLGVGGAEREELVERPEGRADGLEGVRDFVEDHGRDDEDLTLLDRLDHLRAVLLVVVEATVHQVEIGSLQSGHVLAVAGIDEVDEELLASIALERIGEVPGTVWFRVLAALHLDVLVDNQELCQTELDEVDRVEDMEGHVIVDMLVDAYIFIGFHGREGLSGSENTSVLSLFHKV
jgi:hypothetical protein